jgi:hypothetical protein
MTSSEVKLDVLANTVKEMMQKISRKEEIVVQRPHVPLVPEKKRSMSPNILQLSLNILIHPMIISCIQFTIQSKMKFKIRRWRRILLI